MNSWAPDRQAGGIGLYGCLAWSHLITSVQLLGRIQKSRWLSWASTHRICRETVEEGPLVRSGKWEENSVILKSVPTLLDPAPSRRWSLTGRHPEVALNPGLRSQRREHRQNWWPRISETRSQNAPRPLLDRSPREEVAARLPATPAASGEVCVARSWGVPPHGDIGCYLAGNPPVPVEPWNG